LTKIETGYLDFKSLKNHTRLVPDLN